MRKVSLLFFLILALTACPVEARRHWGLWGFFSTPHVHRHEHRHHSYVRRDIHARARSESAKGGTYTMAQLVPPEWQLQPTDPNLKGQRFVSPDGEGSLALYATPVQEPIAKHMNTIAFVEGEQITSLHGEKNWIEVSGVKADRSFYRKAVLACDGRVWHEVTFEYPTQNEGRIIEFVNRAAKAVRNSKDQGCEESTAVDESPAVKVPTPPSSSSGD